MGLAGPRKRLKISHDPNNLTWAQSAESYGQRLLCSQGWKPGQGLGASGARTFNSPIPATKLSSEEDNLGLGASLDSANPDHYRTGLDAFQDLLGRLNSKDDAEARRLDQKSEDRKLAKWSHGKWGGVMFVYGGLLIQGDEFRKADDEKPSPVNAAERPLEGSDEKSAREEARALRKAERRKRREAKLKNGTEGNSAGSKPKPESMTDMNLKNVKNMTESKDEARALHIDDSNVLNTTRKAQKKKRKAHKDPHDAQIDSADQPIAPLPDDKSVADAVQLPTPVSECKDAPIPLRPLHLTSRNGRHLIRRREIQAKRMAFANDKMLDEIFMRKS